MQIQPGFICQKKDEYCDQRATGATAVRWPGSRNVPLRRPQVRFHRLANPNAKVLDCWKCQAFCPNKYAVCANSSVSPVRKFDPTSGLEKLADVFNFAGWQRYGPVQSRGNLFDWPRRAAGLFSRTEQGYALAQSNLGILYVSRRPRRGAGRCPCPHVVQSGGGTGSANSGQDVRNGRTEDDPSSDNRSAEAARDWKPASPPPPR